MWDGDIEFISHKLTFMWKLRNTSENKDRCHKAKKLCPFTRLGKISLALFSQEAQTKWTGELQEWSG